MHNVKSETEQKHKTTTTNNKIKTNKTYWKLNEKQMQTKKKWKKKVRKDKNKQQNKIKQKTERREKKW